MYFSFQLLFKNSVLGQLQIKICKMSELNKGPKYVILIVFTMLLVLSGYEYIITVTIRTPGMRQACRNILIFSSQNRDFISKRLLAVSLP